MKHNPRLGKRLNRSRFLVEAFPIIEGIIYIRKSATDLRFPDDRKYGSVIINLADKYIVRGMACYADDDKFPKGIDVIYHTTICKSLGLNGKYGKIFKKLSKSKNNPYRLKDWQVRSYGTYMNDNSDTILVLNDQGLRIDLSSEWASNISRTFLSRKQKAFEED